MLLGGLWHGAAWRFVVWGGLHGLGLAGERFVADRRTALGRPAPRDTRGRRVVRRILTFHLVTVAWLFFRADSVGTALSMLGRVVTSFSFHTTLVTPAVLIAITVALVAQYVPRPTVGRALVLFSRMGPVVQGAVLAFALVVIDALGPEGVAAFIYFQF